MGLASQILPAALVALSVCSGARAGPLTEDSCPLLASDPGEKATLRDVPGLTVLDRPSDEPFVLFGIDEVRVKGVLCWRSEARLSRNDYVVPAAGFPLYIKTDYDDEGQNRSIVLESTSAGFRVRLLSGPEWSDAERIEVRQLIAFYNSTQQSLPNKTLEPTR